MGYKKVQAADLRSHSLSVDESRWGPAGVIYKRKVIFPLGIRERKSWKTPETMQTSGSQSVAQGPYQRFCEVRTFFIAMQRCYLTDFFFISLQVDVELSRGHMTHDIATD